MTTLFTTAPAGWLDLALELWHQEGLDLQTALDHVAALIPDLAAYAHTWDDGVYQEARAAQDWETVSATLPF